MASFENMWCSLSYYATPHYSNNSSNLITSFSVRTPAQEDYWRNIKNKSQADIWDSPPLQSSWSKHRWSNRSGAKFQLISRSNQLLINFFCSKFEAGFLLVAIKLIKISLKCIEKIKIDWKRSKRDWKRSIMIKKV